MNDLTKKYIIGENLYTRDEIIHRYLHLVKYVAGKILVNAPSNIDINDLINDGVVGLIDAIHKFDNERGIKFETYAITRIHGAILDSLRVLDWVPRNVRKSTRDLNKARDIIENESGRLATNEELAEKLNISIKDVHAVKHKAHITTVSSLEEKLENQEPHQREGLSLIDRLGEQDVDISKDVEQNQIYDELLIAVERLSTKERLVITLYYFDRQTLKDIKQILGVSESRVSQIHTNAIVNLRKNLENLRKDLGIRLNDPTYKKKYHGRNRKKEQEIRDTGEIQF